MSEDFLQLRNFLFNCIIITSCATLIVFAFLSAFMLDGTIPMINDWETWFFLCVPFNLVVILFWTYRFMVMGKPVFFPVFNKDDMEVI